MKFPYVSPGHFNGLLQVDRYQLFSLGYFFFCYFKVFNNYLVNAELGVDSALSKTLSLKTYLVDNFNNQPASGRQKNDVKLISGISYNF